FQTMVSDLTGMELANASLLDEATAASEAMIMLYNTRPRAMVKEGVLRFFVSDRCFPQTLEVLRTKAAPLGIELVVGDLNKLDLTEPYFGLLVQYPDTNGSVEDLRAMAAEAASREIRVVVATDLMSLALLTPPGEWGADVVVGSTQRFGVPLGYGGPHAAFFATMESYKRHLPGRIIGVSQDREGKPGLRMALQTREQHIRREKATSNICTAQALLAIMAGMYGVYHGPARIRAIATRIHQRTMALDNALQAMGIQQRNTAYFDTLYIEVADQTQQQAVQQAALAAGINFRYDGATGIGISLDETVSEQDLQDIVAVFAKALGTSAPALSIPEAYRMPETLQRTSEFMTHPSFNSYQSETDMMRYLKSLENKDISLTHSMISLGSCTMKLNAASELAPITMPEFANIHPFVPLDQAAGYQAMIAELEKDLCTITGFDAVSFQPNSGAQGEYTGLMVIRAYHHHHGDHQRDVTLIPSSAHGTNPASAVMAGMKVVVVKCDDDGNIDLDDLKEKAATHADRLSALMVTYPSTHGVFETAIREVTETIHAHGGLVYMDGANMNAQVGLTNPAIIGADVCHLNLHKTFAIPHGGGGPGMGPIGVTAQLAPFLPAHPLLKTGGEQGISAIAAAPWSSALILLISY
ncbi:MAG: aminomethyl-transferring glycine dehydrogenase, partial [Bacteroidota bacterium]